MLERSRRPMGDEDRRILAQYREQTIGRVSFEARATVYAGLVGVAAAFVWLCLFHLGDRATPDWILLTKFAAFVAAGAVVGFPIDLSSARNRRKARQQAAATQWDPVVAVGIVEHVVAEASRGVRIDDSNADTAWFLEVGEGQVLCVWDWADDATEHVEVDLVPGATPTVLKISWTGTKLTPVRPKRKFKRGERRPEQAEVLNGDLGQLDRLLAERATSPRKRVKATPASRLADEVEPLGFYKYVSAEQVAGVKADIDEGAEAWLLGAGRAFEANCEALAEGGVKDLLDDMRPALKVEGVELGDVEQSYDPEKTGYVVRVGTDPHTMWNGGEAKASWELTPTRAAGLLNGWLTKAGSQERIHLLHDGEDGVFVLLTPGQRDLIAKSGAFHAGEVPTPL